MAKDTIGAKGVAVKESTVRVANSQTCLRIANPPISKTDPNTQESDRVAMLEILQQSLQNYIEAGGKVKVLNMPTIYDSVAILLEGVKSETA